MKQPIEVVMLPTEDESFLYLNKDKRLGMHPKLDYVRNTLLTNQHVYVTVSQDLEKPEKGDWVYSIYGFIVQVDFIDDMYIHHVGGGNNRIDCYRKIIATDDPKLIIDLSSQNQKDNYIKEWKKIPQVPQSFLEEFVANPEGKWEVEYEDISYYKEDTHPTQDNGKWVKKFQLKLNPDNTVNITSVKPKLPKFLYKEKDDTIRIGYNADLDVTKEWNDWLKENL